MMEENINETDSVARSCDKILDALDADDTYSAMNNSDFLLNILPDEFKKQHNLITLHKKIRDYLKNTKKNRLLRLLQRLKIDIETAVEYYSPDIGNDERLFYQDDFETELIQLHSEIRKMLAIVITKHQTELNLG